MTDATMPAVSAVDRRAALGPWRMHLRWNGRALNAYLTFVLARVGFHFNNPAPFLIPGHCTAFLFTVPAKTTVRDRICSLVATWGPTASARAASTCFPPAALSKAATASAPLASRCSPRWDVFGLPVPDHVAIAVGWTAPACLLFAYHRFGFCVQMVSDKPDSARQAGNNFDRIRVAVFIWSGVAATLYGVIREQTANMVWLPTSGRTHLLIALAAPFVGGTPTWGRVGTILSAC